MFNEVTLPQRGSLHQTVVKRKELIEKLVENKAKHDAALEAAILGYWKLADKTLAEKEDNFYSRLAKSKKAGAKLFKSLKTQLDKKQVLPNSISLPGGESNCNLGLSYPENHSKDYERVIQMMELEVHDEIVLSQEEFRTYVMNEWSWKSSFLGNISALTQVMSGVSYGTGSYVDGWVGSFGDKYLKSRQDAYDSISVGSVNF